MNTTSTLEPLNDERLFRFFSILQTKMEKDQMASQMSQLSPKPSCMVRK